MISLLLLLTGAALAGLTLYSVRGTDVGRTRAAPALLALGYGLPAVFLALALLWVSASGSRFRVSLLGAGFLGEPGRHFSVSLGANQETADLWIADLIPRSGGTDSLGAIRFIPPQDGAGERRGSLRLAAAPQSAVGLLAYEGAQGQEILRGLELAEGDLVLVGGVPWRLQDGGVFLPETQGVAGKSLAIPPRPLTLPLFGELPFESLRPWSIGERTFPVDWLAAGGDAGRLESRFGSFFYQKPAGLGRGRLFLALLDPDIEVQRGGQEVSVPGEIELPAASRVAIRRLPDPASGFLAGGAYEKRSFRVFPGERSVALIFDTPEVHTLNREQLERLAGAAVEGDRLRILLTLGDWSPTGTNSLYLRHASRRVAGEALASVELPRSWWNPLAGQDTVRLATVRGMLEIPLGTPVWLGGKRFAAVQLDALAPPVWLGLLGLLLAWARLVTAHRAGISVVQLLFAASLEMLLAIRLLLGYRVWAMVPYDQEALTLALIAWVLVPWLFLLFCHKPIPRGLSDLAPALAGGLFSCIWCARLGGGGWSGLLWTVLHGAAFLWLLGPALLDAARIVRKIPRFALLRRLGSALWLRALVRRAGALAGAVAGRFAKRSPYLLWNLLPWLFSVVRFGLAVLGFKESLPLGERLSLSLVHIPLAVLLEAGYFAWLWRRGEKRLLAWKDLVPALGIALGVWILPAILVSDLGLALLNLPVFLIALAGALLASDLRGKGVFKTLSAYRVASAALFLFLMAVGSAGVVRSALPYLPESWARPSERNYLRVLAFAYPDQLQAIATRSSEELVVMSRVMKAYTLGPQAWLGQGYSRGEISPHLRATALREHVPSVFLAGEWGFAGALGVLLVFAALTASSLAAAPWSGVRAGRPGSHSSGHEFTGALAALAGGTLGISSIYMLLANYGLLLFTGKNVYLLGLDSGTDLVESLLLTGIVATASAAIIARRVGS